MKIRDYYQYSSHLTQFMHYLWKVTIDNVGGVF